MVEVWILVDNETAAEYVRAIEPRPCSIRIRPKLLRFVTLMCVKNMLACQY
jgi:hypothetical protein